jgi:hypothetical protein
MAISADLPASQRQGTLNRTGEIDYKSFILVGYNIAKIF